jgi:small subunit ribosomal protein S13
LARISGVNIPSGKRVEIALTYVFGIGSTRAKKICKEARLDPSKRVNSLTEDELGVIRDIIEKKIYC